MKNKRSKSIGITLIIFLIACGPALAQDKPPRGADKVDAPSVGEGLCVHNLVQSNMVLQRDKPLRRAPWPAGT